MDDDGGVRAWWAGVALLAALAFVLRLIGLGQSPAGDEVILHSYVDHTSFSAMWSQVVHLEKTPPLGFVLSWLTSHLGPADPWMRVPSLLAGTATVPLVALLARRCATPAAGLAAAAFAAVSPFLLFYGVEARAYALAACLACASTVLLLAAGDRGGRWRWAAWAVVSALAVLSHYTAVFVLVAGAAWALVAFPARRRSLLLAAAGGAVLVAWWIPSLVTQWGHAGDEAGRIGALAPLSVSTLTNIVPRALIGHPLWSGLQTVPTSEVPGTAGLALILAGLVVAAVAGMAMPAVAPTGARRPRPETVLLLMLALATPVGVVLLSLEPGRTLLLPRNLICSLPAAAGLVGLLVTRPRRPVAIACTLLVAAGLLLGSVRELRRDGRPAMAQAAAAVSARWQPGDVILEAVYLSRPPLDRDLLIHLRGAPRGALALTSRVALTPFQNPREPGTSVFTVAPLYERGFGPLDPPAAQRRRWTLVWRERWAGAPEVVASQWRLLAPPRR